MMRMDEFYNPTPNITDMATGTRNLDNEGLAALRGMTDETENIGSLEKSMLDNTDYQNKKKALSDTDRSGLMSRLDEIVAKKKADAAKTTPFDEAVEYNARPEDVVQNLVDQKFGIGYFDNVGATPSQRGSAREFLVEALKKENPNQTNFSDIIDAVDVKYITEGGGGLAGDPLTIVNKYFGPRIAEMVPSGASSEEIAIFTERVLNNVVDANGLRPGDPRFDRLTAKFTENFAQGGRVAFQGGGMDMGNEENQAQSASMGGGSSAPGPGDTGGEGGNNPNDGSDSQFGGGNNSDNNNNGNNNNTTTTKSNKLPFTIGTVSQQDSLIGAVPTKFGLEALLRNNRLRALLDAEESLKEGNLMGDITYSGNIGPVDINAYGDLDGTKSLNLNYNKGNFNIGAGIDDQGNKNMGLRYNRTFARGGLAKILEV